MEVLYDKALQLEKEANNVKAAFERSRNSNSNWSNQKKAKVDQLSKQAKYKTSSQKIGLRKQNKYISH